MANNLDIEKHSKSLVQKLYTRPKKLNDYSISKDIEMCEKIVSDYLRGVLSVDSKNKDHKI